MRRRAPYQAALAQHSSAKVKRVNRAWAETHARRLADRLGDLLELAWMAETALSHAQTDATAALLTSIAAYDLFPDENAFAHPALAALSQYADALIEERPIQADIARL